MYSHLFTPKDYQIDSITDLEFQRWPEGQIKLIYKTKQWDSVNIDDDSFNKIKTQLQHHHCSKLIKADYLELKCDHCLDSIAFKIIATPRTEYNEKAELVVKNACTCYYCNKSK